MNLWSCGMLCGCAFLLFQFARVLTNILRKDHRVKLWKILQKWMFGTAARALFNHMYYEAGRMAHEHAEAALIKESLLGLPRPALGTTLQDEDNRAST